ncbi:hypothetical protein PGT21_029208 [Puccinia graminis f. sp. tritici]|uniref:Uncharacterized protein n=2 Tax=Puccinia graminis f. sp. tritici TaxID=56615 RepID=E3KPT9_PUCGT|nr:uncharacterized protein PGTG_12280 [Puccinia graminis f. sp. tritici CRL 75-36-700-3]KAA1075056.1 hypothetical protein PGT21_027863 [Puccinia graminis f. sp. tritici]EFP86324.2 hypothetical protein PGTG_12280 [Puccinia graminis f. sp. tritici CRL 75-36-700-3]KAA1081093.1 hypothetical protein PGT21_029208 [Puccinia graminis f. sp. tritici]KAA1126562.1 hypothetical protein PGTUg99_027803 [Puccinia graminis f. sp. tritici]KAA1131254.1 hypothetical protein PGTUg99_027639 [Puccinia graminis f. s
MASGSQAGAKGYTHFRGCGCASALRAEPQHTELLSSHQTHRSNYLFQPWQYASNGFRDGFLEGKIHEKASWSLVIQVLGGFLKLYERSPRPASSSQVDQGGYDPVLDCPAETARRRQ